VLVILRGIAIVIITTLPVQHGRAQGTTIGEFHDAKGNLIGTVKFFGNHQWHFYDAAGKDVGTVDDRITPSLCLAGPNNCVRPPVFQFIKPRHRWFGSGEPKPFDWKEPNQ
jgi:hypothetical protein